MSQKSSWRKLDNAALAFPASTGKKDSRVFRFYCELKEEVCPEILQEALDKTMEKYPLYQSVLRKGFFWFYFEQRNIKAVVKPESEPPCSRIYVPDKKSLLFEVSFYKRRINLEVFHALTDGTGAMIFLCELVKTYLNIKYGLNEDGSGEVEESIITIQDLEEDSFSQYYSEKNQKDNVIKRKAAQISGKKVNHDQMRITECILPADQVIRNAKLHGVSVTVYLTAVLLMAVHEEMTKKQERRPVIAMIPVNLRSYFPSKTMANFFGWLEAGYLFREDTTLEEVIMELKAYFAKELQKQEVQKRMNAFVKLEKNLLIRAVPLELKNLILSKATELGSNSVTVIFSNMGVIRMPEECRQYIQRFGFFTSTYKLQLCTCSYENEMYFGITSKFLGTNIQRNIIEILKKQGIDLKVETGGFPKREKEKDNFLRKTIQWFTFLCIAVSVFSGMVEWIVTPSIHWAWFVTGGAACCWVAVMTAIIKRRNLLKNSLWQLLFISGACVVWDFLTEWKGWSADFVIPFASLVILFSVIGIAKIRKLEKEEYLFYTVLAAMYGLLPFLLLVLDVVQIRYPSIICSGISFLVLIWICIFRFKDFTTELYKKFRM